MNKINFDGTVKKHFDSAFGILMAVMTLIVVCTKFIALPNNLIFSDEGWYLCLLRDLPHFGSTRFHLLFHNVFNNDVFAIRMTCLLSQLLASVYMSLGLAKWIHRSYPNTEMWKLFVMVLCASFWGQMGIEACPSFNYINLNKIFVEFGVGFLLFGLIKQEAFYYLFSGFMMAFLFPIMITNVIVIPVMLTVILILSNRKIQDGLMFCLGIVLFVVLYFVVVESPEEIFSFIETETKNVVNRGEADYGILFLIEWILNAVKYLCKFFFMAIFLYCAYILIIKRHVIHFDKTVNYVIWGITSIIILFYFWNCLPPELPFIEHYSIVGMRGLYWIVLFILLIDEVIGNAKIKFDEMVLTVFLLIIPITLSFGSNVPFDIRQGSYFVFITPLIILYSLKRGMLCKTILMFFVCFTFVFFLKSLSGRNWHGEKHFGEHIPVKSIGIEQNIKLTEQHINFLVECRNRIPQGKVLCDFENWGTVCLLGYTPVCYEFDIRFDDVEKFQKIVDESVMQEGHLWVVASKWDKRFLDKLTMVEGYNMSMDEDDRNCYFHFQKPINK